jgi:hypothetical protein
VLASVLASVLFLSTTTRALDGHDRTARARLVVELGEVRECRLDLELLEACGDLMG